MPQWNSKSLTILICTFSVFLFVFNFFASFVGPIAHYEPLSTNPSSFNIRMRNLKRWNFPLSIVSYPYTKPKQSHSHTSHHISPTNNSPNSNIEYINDQAIKQINFNGYCKNKLVFSNQSLSLPSPFVFGVFRFCTDFDIFVYPFFQQTSLFLRSKNTLLSIILTFIRYSFIFIIFFSFYRFFSLGKNLSVMRSVLVIQICVIMMLDPFIFLSSFFPSLFFFHYVFFGFGWWRCACEIFTEYAPLVRQKASLFKYVFLIPLVSFLAVYFFRNEKNSSESRLKTVVVVFSCLCGLVLPIFGIWFIFKAGNTSGKSALFIHLFAGILALTVVYFLKIFMISYENFADSFLSYSMEISFLAAYAMFQAIFQAGESSDESEQHLPHQQTNIRYEKIEELLESLTNMDDTVKFDLAE
ncbi:hypothetical protein TRFO_37524 [Tritrichomonas foetus]|uniref:Transmembrane protein n=1 Tax=Tritrichomonas foetus TaxID=1144522 RepID=A0A1J4JGH7_9EUKA|nr:hypothetical protein TRFO_37524 [Tritrichomonas foetus]|eukprot:OHS96308.1 hypothetical protein TRFO_37524 [Tritrichomonas foetus]